MTYRDDGRLSEWMEPDLDEKAITKQWLGVRDRVETMKRRRYLGFGALLTVAAATAAFIVFAPSTVAPPRERSVATLPRERAPDPSPSVNVTTGETAESVRLLDESEISVSPHSSCTGVATREDVHLSLARGAASFDVTHVPNRAFVVDAGPVSVRVVGTKFRVERNGDSVRVHVERGRVEVRSPNGSTFVGAGESWPSPAAVDPRPRVERREEPSLAAGAPETPAVNEAESLFAQATAARRSGSYETAARHYGDLIDRFPRDARASLASYELGRMYLDAMRQPARAVGPLRRAISSSPRGASYREDAMARLVAAYSRSGQAEACAQARDRYLAEYASGLHRTAVSRSCTVE